MALSYFSCWIAAPGFAGWDGTDYDGACGNDSGVADGDTLADDGIGTDKDATANGDGGSADIGRWVGCARRGICGMKVCVEDLNPAAYERVIADGD